MKLITTIRVWLAGWRPDLEGWYVRARRATDPDLTTRSDLGFTEEACIAVRTKAIALQIDKMEYPALSQNGDRK